MSNELKEEIIRLINEFVVDSDAVHETINHLSDIVDACAKGVDDLTARRLAELARTATKG